LQNYNIFEFRGRTALSWLAAFSRVATQRLSVQYNGSTVYKCCDGMGTTLKVFRIRKNDSFLSFVSRVISVRT
jgi:hypothetical protein